MTDDKQQFDVTDAERQLIECLREAHRTNQRDSKFQLVIEHEGGAWEIEMSQQGGNLSEEIGARGVGATFDQAWIRMDPHWA